MDEKTQKYLLYAFMAIVVIGAAWAVSSFFTGGSAEPAGHSAAQFQQLEEAKAASGAAGQSDPCAPPDGISEEDWKTHMSHHPDMYPGCL